MVTTRGEVAPRQYPKKGIEAVCNRGGTSPQAAEPALFVASSNFGVPLLLYTILSRTDFRRFDLLIFLANETCHATLRGDPETGCAPVSRRVL
jgi:hypothetical protein